MKSNLTERDLNRIILRVINEQQEPNNSGGEKMDMVKDFGNRLAKLTGTNPTELRNVVLKLFGLSNVSPMGQPSKFEVTVTDIPTRIQNYEKMRKNKGLTQLPSGELITLLMGIQ